MDLWQWLWGGSVAALLLGVPLYLSESLFRQYLPPTLLYLAWSLFFLRLLWPAPWLISLPLAEETPLSLIGNAPALTNIWPWLTAWVTGMLIFTYLMLLAYQYWQRQMLSRSRLLRGPDFQLKLAFLKKQLGLKHCPAIYLSRDQQSPLMAGLLRPVIVLPKEWSTLSCQEQDLMLLHELCHFRRKDHWQRGILLLIQLLFWFHPMVWLAARRFRQQQEIHCDRLVLRTYGGDNRAYQRLLLEQLYRQGNRKDGPVLGSLGFGGRSVIQRVSLLRSPVIASTARKGIFAGMVVFLLGCSLVVPALTPGEWLAAQQTENLPGSVSKRYSVLARINQSESPD